MFSLKTSCMAGLIFAAVLPAASARADGDAKAPAAKKLACQGEAKHKKEAQEHRDNGEKDPIYLFAAKTFGAPTSCRFKWETSEGQLFATLVYEFKGATLTETSSPPETFTTELVAKDGFPDEPYSRKPPQLIRGRSIGASPTKARTPRPAPRLSPSTPPTQTAPSTSTSSSRTRSSRCSPWAWRYSRSRRRDHRLSTHSTACASVRSGTSQRESMRLITPSGTRLPLSRARFCSSRRAALAST